MNTNWLRDFWASRHENALRRAAAIAPSISRRVETRHRRKRVLALWLVVVIACIALDGNALAVFAWLESYAYNTASAVRAAQHPAQAASDIVIVNLSDDSFAPGNPQRLPGPPVPRDRHGKLLEFLSSAGAKVVAFDFLFDVPRQQDAAFLKGVRAAQRRGTQVLWACLPDENNRLLVPDVALRKANPKMGHIIVENAADRPSIERVRGFISDERGGEIPALSIQVLRALRGKEYSPPLDHAGYFSIRYVAQGGESFPYVPYEALLTPGGDSEFYRDVFFKNKIVLVGDTTKIGNDFKETPLGAMPGIEVQAHAVSTLLQGRFERKAAPWLIWLLIALLAFPAAALFDAPRLRTLILLVFVCGFGYSLLFAWLFVERDFVLHFVAPIAALLLSMIGVLIERGLHEERERQRMFDAFVLAASSAIEARDPSTAGHSRRVTCLTVELAIAVSTSHDKRFTRTKFSRAQIKELCYAALLHDFGKIGVHESVLTKSHKLEPQHFEVVQSRVRLLRAAREAEYSARRAEVLQRALQSQSTENLNEEIETLEAQKSEALGALDRDLKLLRRANDPQVTFLPDEEYSALEALVHRLQQQAVCDEHGAMKPLLSDEEAAALLVRKGSLTLEEYKQIQAHAQLSYEFLTRIHWTRDLENLAHIAWGHHEKLSGGGYPRGVGAEEIPLATRMMTIADIFDALTASDRPYKKALSVERALEILSSEAQSGALDCELLEIFIERHVYESIKDGRGAWLLSTERQPL